MLLWSEHDAAQAEIEKLRLLIRQLQRGQFGRRSEKLDPDQLQLGLEDLEQTVAAAEAAQEEAAARNSTPRPPRVRRRNLGALPAHLPRVEVLVDLEDKSCPCCGGALHAIGEDTSEMLDIVPAQLRVKVIRRPALRLPGLRGGGGAGTRPGAADHRRDGDRGAARARAGGQVRRFPAALPPCVDGPRPAREIFRDARWWSLAVMCPASLVRPTETAGPDGIRGSRPHQAAGDEPPRCRYQASPDPSARPTHAITLSFPRKLRLPVKRWPVAGTLLPAPSPPRRSARSCSRAPPRPPGVVSGPAGARSRGPGVPPSTSAAPNARRR